MLSDTPKLVCTIMNLPWSMAKGPGHRITYKWCFVGRDDWRNVYCDHAPKTPEMSNFLHFAKRFVDIVADMRLSTAYDSMIPRKRITSSVTSILVLASLTPSTPWLQSYLIGRYQSVHVDQHSSTPTLSTFGVPRDQSTPGASALFYIYLRYRPFIQCSAPSVRWRHQHHADLYISFFRRLFSWHIKSHSLIHSLTVSPLMILF